MAYDDDFEPRLGKIRSRGSKGNRKFLHRVLAATNLARGGADGARKSRFNGSRLGRGAGAGRVLAARDRYAAFRQRRVIVKARIVKLAGKGMDGARAHLRYIQRDGVTREGEPGKLYDAHTDEADGKAFLDVAKGAASYSQVMETKGPKMLGRDFTPEGRVRQTLKDVHMMLDQGARVGQRLPMLGLHCEVLEACVRAGEAEQDNSIVVEEIRRRRSR